MTQTNKESRPIALSATAGSVARAVRRCARITEQFGIADNELKRLMSLRYGLDGGEEIPDEIVEIAQYGGTPLSAQEIDRIMEAEGYPPQNAERR